MATKSISAETAVLNLPPNDRGRRGQIVGGNIRLVPCAERLPFCITMMSITQTTALSMFYLGKNSFRNISLILKTAFNIKASHTTVSNWCVKFAPMFDDMRIQLVSLLDLNSDEWHADETVVKIAGVKHYIWFIIDSETRFVIGFHLSPHRDSPQAVSLFSEVVQLGKRQRLFQTVIQPTRFRSSPFLTVRSTFAFKAYYQLWGKSQTFYYHFEDIYELLKWMLEAEAIEVVKKFDLLVDYREAVLFVLDYVKTNKHLLCCAYDSMGRDEMKRFFIQSLLALRGCVILNAEQQLGVCVEEQFKIFLAKFYTKAIAGMLIDELTNKKGHDPEQAVQYLSFILKHSLPNVLLAAKSGGAGAQPG